MSKLSDVLKQRRKDLGLTLAQIADKMDVAEATVQRWESGNIKSVRYEKIAKLAEILKVEPAALMGWDDKTPTTQTGSGDDDKTKELRDLWNNADEAARDAILAAARLFLKDKS